MGVILGYPHLIKENIIKLFKFGIINTHFGLIPRFRGNNPIVWSILSKKLTGYTIYNISKKLDSGKIIKYKKFKIDPNDTSFSIYKKFSYDSLNELVSLLDKFKKKLKIDYIKELDIKNKYYKKKFPNNGFVSFSWKSEFLKRFSNAFYFPPYNCCLSFYQNRILSFSVIQYYNKGKSDFIKIGMIEKKINNREYLITSIDGSVKILLDKNINLKVSEKLFTPKNYLLDINHHYNKLFFDTK